MAELDRAFFVPGMDKIEVEVDMLDFGFIEKCTDWVKLLKVLETLKTGQEGHYPELTRAAEERMLAVMPAKERKRYLALTRVASNTEVAEAEADLMSWLKQTSKIDQKLANAKNTLDIYGNNSESAGLSPPLKVMNKSQLHKIQDATVRLKVDSLTALQRERKAESERRKGNECFKSRDYDDSVKYYTDSIALCDGVEATWTNRAIAYIKKELYDLAEADCNAALVINASSIKALTRRGLSRISQGKYKQAAYDFHTALTLEPNSAELVKLLDQALTKYKETEGIDLILPSIKKQYGQHHEEEEKDSVQESKTSREESKPAKQFFRVVPTAAKSFEDLIIPTGMMEKISMGLLSISEHVAESTESEGFVRIQIEEDDEDEDDESPVIPDEQEPAEEGFVRIPIATEDDDEDEDEEEEEAVEEAAPLTNEEKAQNLKDFGNQLMQSGDVQGALDAYNTSIALHPSHLTLNNRAQAKLNLKDFDGAIADSTAVLQEDPKNMKALFRRAKARFEVKKYKESYQDAQEVLTLDAENAAAKKLLEDIQKVAGAVVAVLDGERSDKLKVQGNKAMEEGKYSEAVQLYSNALEIDEDNIAALNNRTLAYLKLKKFAEADTDAGNVIRYSNDLPSDQAVSYKKKALFRRAEARYNRGLEMELNSPEKALPFFRGAKSDITELLKLDPTGGAKAVKELENMVNGSIESVEEDFGKVKKSQDAMKEVAAKLSEEQTKLKAPVEKTAAVPVPATTAVLPPVPPAAAVSPVKNKESIASTPSPASKQSKVSSASKSPRLKENISLKVEAPAAAPKTLYEFERMWRGLQGHPQLRIEYLELFKKSTYKKVFKEAISSDLIGSIFQTLNTESCSMTTAKKVLDGLMEMKSFTLTISLIPQEDMDSLQDVFRKLYTQADTESNAEEREKLRSEIATLQQAFGIKL